MTLGRRSCLKLLGAAGAAMLAPAPLAAMRRRVERVGLQLYTVRELLDRDASSTLARVADAGYAEVETAGTGSLTAAQFATALGNAGLSAPSAHVPLEAMLERPDEVLAMADTIGHRFLVLPWIAPDRRNTAGYTTVIETLNRFGERCAAEDIQLCYHNHDFEFAPLDGGLPYDRLLKECDRELVRFELDLYWVTHAGANGAAYLEADPARFPLCHVKDRGADGSMLDVGQGTIDFAALFAAGSGFAHYFVEHDRPADPLQSIRTSIAAVREIRF